MAQNAKERVSAEVNFLLAVRPFVIGVVLAVAALIYRDELAKFYERLVLGLTFAFLVSLIWTFFGVVIAVRRFQWSRQLRRNQPVTESPPNPSQDMQREEYRQAIEYDKHLTSLNWQTASIFVAGVIIGLAEVMARSPNHKYPFNLSVGVVSVFGIFAIAVWFLIVSRNRDMATVALDRARRLESNDEGLMRRMHSARLTGVMEIDGETIVISSPHGYTTVKFIAGSFVLLLSIILILSLSSLPT